MRASLIPADDGPERITVTATKAEWLEVVDKLKWIPDSALRDDGFSQLVHWLINQGVYDE